MRITSTAKYFFLLLLGMAAISALIFYLVLYQWKIAEIAGYVLMGFVMLFIGYVVFGQLFSFLSEQAGSIERIYVDESKQGLHLFSSFSVSRYKTGQSPLRTMQYYFFVADTGKNYYTTLLTHDTRSASGRSGYEDNFSFEEDIIKGEELKKAMEKFSDKVGWPLRLGHNVYEGENYEYATTIGDLSFRVENKEALIRDYLVLCCFNADGTRRWRKKL